MINTDQLRKSHVLSMLVLERSGNCKINVDANLVCGVIKRVVLPIRNIRIMYIDEAGKLQRAYKEKTTRRVYNYDKNNIFCAVRAAAVRVNSRDFY